jgi:hypothetical protein
MNKQELEIVYVDSFYDFPLGGLCYYDGKIERFVTDYDTKETTIIHLTSWERFKALCSKKLFEICVGKHHSYVNNKRPHYFYWRKPVFLHKIIFNLYFKRWPWHKTPW